MLEKREPVRLQQKQDPINVPIGLIIAGSLVFGIFFAIIGILGYHYGVFL